MMASDASAGLLDSSHLVFLAANGKPILSTTAERRERRSRSSTTESSNGGSKTVAGPSPHSRAAGRARIAEQAPE